MSSQRVSRRRWLTVCAGATVGMAGLAGCTSGSDEETPDPSDDPGAVGADGNYGVWPMIRYNAANRLAGPHAGVDGEPEIAWTAELEGRAESPVVYDDTAFVNHGPETCTAVDLRDGDDLWHQTTGGGVTIAVSEAGVFVRGDGLTALDRDDGDVLWTSGHDRTARSVRIYDDGIYAGLDDSVVAFDADGDELLEFETPERVQSLAIDDDHVYVRCREDRDTDDFVMAGYDRDSGDQLWTHEISHDEQWVDDRASRTFPVVDGTVYTVTNDAVIGIDGVDSTVDEVVTLDQTAWSRPTIYDDVAYIQPGSRAYDLETGDTPEDWERDESGNIPVAVGDGTGYTLQTSGTDPPNLVAMDLRNGDAEWVVQTPERADYQVPVVLDGMILQTLDPIGLVAYE